MRPTLAWPLGLLIAALVGAATFAVAWICDDALVTLRHVENLAAGDGFCWNVADRAQTATHPLWILLLAGVRCFSGEPFFTTMVVGVVFTTFGALLLARHAGGPVAAVGIVGVALLGSRAFVEFGTGGLENPFVYALLAGYLHVWTVSKGARRLRRLALVGALLGLARQDVGLLIFPSGFWAMRGLSWREIVAAIWPGLLLVLMWCGFALIYFGTLMPTPAYGKVVAADVDSMALFTQGLRYFADVLARDPLTITVLVLAIVAGFWRPSGDHTPLAIGVLLQVLYALKVGGDFMSGRFFTAAFVVAVFVLGTRVRGVFTWPVIVLLVATTFAPGLPPWARDIPQPSEARIEHGIGNERAYYAATLAWHSPTLAAPKHGEHGAVFAARERPAVLIATTAGAYGFLGGRHVHVVEPFLCDPLLMRLPLHDPNDWRIGHFKRRIPEGYLETLASGENRIVHPALAKYWDALRIVLREPVFSGQRWRTLFGFWAGEYDGLLARYVADGYLPPPLIERRFDELSATVKLGTPWFDADCVVVREGGLRLHRGAGRSGSGDPNAAPAKRLRLLVDGGGSGHVIFRRDGEEVARAPLVVADRFLGGARWIGIELPENAREFDAVDVRLATSDPRIEAKVFTLPVFAVLGVDLGY
ncbi:MAG: hypothetical protein NXI31_23380 [bacterium]|nr:hypothetical protein [bacterium]